MMLPGENHLALNDDDPTGLNLRMLINQIFLRASLGACLLICF